MKIRKLITNNYYLITILFIAAFLRLYKLGTIPPHLTPDEASLGYNAYSILKTGRDEYGTLLPMVFKSFGDWKPGLYVYLTVPFVAIFGLNEWAVRLPSALAGVVAVWFVYKIVKILSLALRNDNRNKKLETASGSESPKARRGNRKLEILAAGLLVINPWHLHFSRGAWEVNVALTLTLAGIYFFLKSLKHNSYFIIPSSIFFALTLITYQGAKLSSLVVLVILVVVYWKKLYHLVRSDPTRVVISGIVGLVIASPILLSIVQGKTGRLEVFSVFSYPRKVEDVQEILTQGDESMGGFSYYIFHSEQVNFARGILSRWFNHFSGRFLFFEGDWSNPRHSAPNHGMLLLWELMLLPLGLFLLVKKKLNKGRLFFLLWLIFAPLPSILSRDSVHAVRAYNLIVPLTIMSAYGLLFVINKLRLFVGVFRVSGYVLLVMIFFGSAIYYFDAYFIHLPKHDSKHWSYGYKQIVEAIAPYQDQYKTIKIQQSFAQPYIYYLFYTAYDPTSYQKQANLVSSEYVFDVGYVESLDNIEFAAIDWPQNKSEHGTLVVADNIRIPQEELESDAVRLIKEIKYPDGNTAFYVVEVI